MAASEEVQTKLLKNAKTSDEVNIDLSLEVKETKDASDSSGSNLDVHSENNSKDIPEDIPEAEDVSDFKLAEEHVINSKFYLTVAKHVAIEQEKINHSIELLLEKILTPSNGSDLEDVLALLFFYAKIQSDCILSIHFGKFTQKFCSKVNNALTRQLPVANIDIYLLPDIKMIKSAFYSELDSQYLLQVTQRKLENVFSRLQTNQLLNLNRFFEDVFLREIRATADFLSSYPEVISDIADHEIPAVTLAVGSLTRAIDVCRQGLKSAMGVKKIQVLGPRTEISISHANQIKPEILAQIITLVRVNNKETKAEDKAEDKAKDDRREASKNNPLDKNYLLCNIPPMINKIEKVLGSGFEVKQLEDDPILKSLFESSLGEKASIVRTSIERATIEVAILQKNNQTVNERALKVSKQANSLKPLVTIENSRAFVMSVHAEYHQDTRPLSTRVNVGILSFRGKQTTKLKCCSVGQPEIWAIYLTRNPILEAASDGLALHYAFRLIFSAYPKLNSTSYLSILDLVGGSIGFFIGAHAIRHPTAPMPMSVRIWKSLTDGVTMFSFTMDSAVKTYRILHPDATNISELEMWGTVGGGPLVLIAAHIIWNAIPPQKIPNNSCRRKIGTAIELISKTFFNSRIFYMTFVNFFHMPADLIYQFIPVFPALFVALGQHFSTWRNRLTGTMAYLTFINLTLKLILDFLPVDKRPSYFPSSKTDEYDILPWWLTNAREFYWLIYFCLSSIIMLRQTTQFRRTVIDPEVIIQVLEYISSPRSSGALENSEVAADVNTQLQRVNVSAGSAASVFPSSGSSASATNAVTLGDIKRLKEELQVGREHDIVELHDSSPIMQLMFDNHRSRLDLEQPLIPKNTKHSDAHAHANTTTTRVKGSSLKWSAFSLRSSCTIL